MLAGIAFALPFLAAILAALAVVPWIMGIPSSHGTNYSRGWEIGLYALVFYPVAFAGFRSLERLARAGWLSTNVAPFRALVWTAFTIFLAAMLWAWWLISTR